MGSDVRIMDIDGAKDPDEYIIKFGNIRFNNLIENAISVIEFKVKVLKNTLNLENVNDKIKFLNEIAKLISKVNNTMEKEVYIEKIAKEYAISKEAIWAEVNKLIYANNKEEKPKENVRPQIVKREEEIKEIPQEIKKRENTIISIILLGDLGMFNLIETHLKPADFKYELNKQIVTKMYEEFKKGNSNINGIIDNLEEKEQSHITSIMAEDYEIENVEKAINDLLKLYEKDKLIERKMEILELLKTEEDLNLKKSLETELSNIIITLVKLR